LHFYYYYYLFQFQANLVHLSNNQPHSVADSQFQTLFLHVFTPFRLSDPILFGIVYTLIFSAAKPAGGILFGVAFWIIARILAAAQSKII
jgi:hypothetical protein